MHRIWSRCIADNTVSARVLERLGLCLEGCLRGPNTPRVEGPNPDDPDQWLIVVNLTAHGGDGQYRYYLDGLPVPGPRIEIVYRACRDKPGSFWVADESGQIVKLEYFFQAPYCPATPTSP